ncbi:MAG: hypothetical protein IPI01_14590 [Ignavibacteriae bacterium]|nr:hypothetical protein [Ignavibacteriota bacterium]
MEAQKHITLVGILTLVHSGLVVAVAILAFGVLTGIGAVSGDEDAFLVLGIIGTVLGGFLLLLSIPGIIGGIALLQRAGWSRVFMIVLSAFKLMDVPVGTALGAYTIYVMLRPDVIAVLDPPAVQPVVATA